MLQTHSVPRSKEQPARATAAIKNKRRLCNVCRARWHRCPTSQTTSLCLTLPRIPPDTIHLSENYFLFKLFKYIFFIFYELIFRIIIFPRFIIMYIT